MFAPARRCFPKRSLSFRKSALRASSCGRGPARLHLQQMMRTRIVRALRDRVGRRCFNRAYIWQTCKKLAIVVGRRAFGVSWSHIGAAGRSRARIGHLIDAIFARMHALPATGEGFSFTIGCAKCTDNFSCVGKPAIEDSCRRVSAKGRRAGLGFFAAILSPVAARHTGGLFIFAVAGCPSLRCWCAAEPD